MSPAPRFRLLLVLLLLVSSAAVPPNAEARRRARTGLLQIESMIEGVKVYVDDKLIGKTPFDKPIVVRVGRHKLKATKFGYSTLEMKFTIRRHKTQTLSVDLIPYSGLVRFTSNVDAAEVYVDGRLIGHAPLIKNVGIGDHKIMIVKDGYTDFETKLNVKAGEKYFVDCKLKPFEDFSPDVMALKKAQEEEKARQQAMAEKLAAQAATPVEPTLPAPAWYEGLHERWWFWTAAGAVVVTAVAVPLAVTSGGSQAGMKAHSSPIDPVHLP